MDNWNNDPRNSSKENRYQEDGNKIRRGPGRRIAKEKRKRYMDPAIQNKYLALPEEVQAEIHAVIEMHYQKQMQAQYKENRQSQNETEDQSLLEE